MKLTWHSTWNSMGWLEFDPRSSRLTKDVTELSRAVAQLPGPPTGGGFLVLPTKIWCWKWRAWRRNKMYENTFQTWRDSFLFIWIEWEEVVLYFSFFCVWKSKTFKFQWNVINNNMDLLWICWNPSSKQHICWNFHIQIWSCILC